MKTLLPLAVMAVLASPLANAYEPYTMPGLADLPGVEVIDYGQSQYDQPQDQAQYGQPLIDAADCIGAVVNGQCYGSPSPRAQTQPGQRCYGAMVGGQCVGAQF